MNDYKFLIKKPGIKSKKTRKKVFKKFVLLILIFIFIISSVYLYNFFRNKIHSPFYVQTIKIIDAKNVSLKKLNNLLNNYREKPFNEISFDKLADKLKKIEWIKDVVIHKNYPSTLIIEITESTPIAILNCNNKFYLIGDNGSLIRHYKKKYLYSGLAICTVKSLSLYTLYKKNILNVFASLQKENIKNVSEIIYKNDIEMFTFNPHGKYILDIDNFEENLSKIKLIGKVKRKFSLNNLKFKEINLKFKNKIIIKL